MSKQAELLARLKLDQQDRQTVSTGASRWWIGLAALAILIAVLAAAWMVTRQPAAPAVRTAVARSAAEVP